METLGWVGAICFALCGVPQALKSYKDKHSHGLSWLFLLLWFFGEALTIIYVWNNPEKQWPLLFNYIFNLACLIVIIFYKITGKEDE